jgi:hypothetical protein
MKEQEIIQKALEEFRAKTGISIIKMPLKESKKFGHDINLKLKTGKQEIEFRAEIKHELRNVHLPKIIDQVNTQRENWLIISQYIPKPLKEELTKIGINYLEASGNCFIRHGELFFYINDQIVTPSRLPEEGKIWKSSGLKFLFLLLQKPEMVNAPYRTLAKTSKIALGNIGAFINELKTEGYLKENKSKNLFFANKEQLTRKWVELFGLIIRPKLKQGTFIFWRENDFKEWELLPTNDFLWGGEAAGAMLTGYLKPERLTMYTDHPKSYLINKLKLIPKENGNVELMKIFWDEEMFKNLSDSSKTVPPLLAYAELATSLDSRNRETAERIKEKYFGQ